ncbi:MAG: hypothetical protein AB1486_18705 [Planctomycetota bacterium]
MMTEQKKKRAVPPELAGHARRVLKRVRADPQDRRVVRIERAIERGDAELVSRLLEPFERELGKMVYQGRLFDLADGQKKGGVLILDDGTELFLPKLRGIDEVRLGRSFDGLELGPDLFLSKKALVRHVLVGAPSGTGKSYLLKLFFLQGRLIGLQVVYFDLEGEARDLLLMFPREEVWGVEYSDLKINIFQPVHYSTETAAQDIEAWKHRITDVLCSVYFGLAGARALFEKVLGDLYEARGCLKGSERWPAPVHVKAAADVIRFPGGSARNYHADAVRRIADELHETMPSFNVVKGFPREALQKHSMVIDTSGMSHAMREFFTCIMLEYLMRAVGRNEELEALAIIDEAHEVASEQQERRQSGSVIPDMMRLGRKHRVGEIIATHNPSAFPAAFHASAGTRICSRLTDVLDQRRMGAGMGLREGTEVYGKLRDLPDRTWMVSSPELGSEPLLVRTEYVDLPPPPTKEQIRAEMVPILLLLNEQIITVEDDLERDGITVRAAEPPQATPAQTPAARATGRLAFKTEKYLIDLNEPKNHYLPLALFSRLNGYALAESTRQRKILSLREFIEEVAIPTGTQGRHPKPAVLTQKGFDYLSRNGIPPHPPPGRGDHPHKFWQHTMRRSFRKAGLEAIIEEHMVCRDHPVDVAVVDHDGRLKAFEVSLSDGNVARNLKADIEGGYDEVIFCVLRRDDKMVIEAKLARELGEGWETLKDRVSFRLLREFLGDDE